MRTGKIREAIQWLQQKLKTISPSDFFDYSFLDEHIAFIVHIKERHSGV